MPEHASLAAALCAAQAEMENATLNKINPHFKNRYADLAAIRDATMPALTKHGLSITQETDLDGANGFYLRTVLRHDKTFETIASIYPLPVALDKPQMVGSAITYARRYSWSALVGIAAEEDDDAERASSGPVKSSRQAKKDGDWKQLTEEINSQQTTADLRAWGMTNRDRINQYSEAWKEQIRDAFAYRLKELGGNEGPPSKLVEDLKNSKAIEDLKEEEAVIDEDITSSDPVAYLDDIDGAMAGAKDVATVMELWEQHQAIKDMLTPADQDKAETILDRHLRQKKADAAVRGGFKRPQ